MILCRLVPIVRTFCPIVAGMGAMPFPRYMRYNIIGAVIWGLIVPLVGYFVGNIFPNARHFILPMVLAIVVFSVLPGIIHYMKEMKN